MRFVTEPKLYTMTSRVEIVFSPESGGILFQESVLFHLGMTVEDALNQTTLFSRYPEAKSFAIGIFSRKVDLTTVLSNGDRIEIYRPLLRNPKDRRRQKAGTFKPSK